MAEMAPGHQSAHSEPPPCYNCGMKGHIFTACPEPTRAIPAGLEASRARQQAGGTHGDVDHPSKRHKGPIVTRYSQPPGPNQIMNQYPPAPPGQPYPYGPPQTYPPNPIPPPYHAPYGSGYVPQQAPFSGFGLPPQPYGANPYGQQSYPPHRPPVGVSGPSIVGGPPPPPYQGFPQHYNQPPGYIPQVPFGYHGGPPGGHGPPVVPPLAHHHPDYKQYPVPPPPNYPGYPPQPPPNVPDPYRPDHRQAYMNHRKDRSDNRHFQDKWGDGRGERRGKHTRERNDQRSQSRDTRWHEHNHQDTRGSFERRKHPRFQGDQNNYDHNRIRSLSRPRSDRSNRSESQKPSRTNYTSSQATPTHDVTVTVAESALAVEELSQTQEAKKSVTPVKIQPTGEEHALPVQLEESNDSVTELDKNESEPLQEDGDSNGDTDFLEELNVAFAEFHPKHQGDPIAEPLPGEYSEQIMLPPAFDAKGLVSKHITPSNLDDFALSVRDTNQWHRYRTHPNFLAPTDVTIENLEAYIRSSQKGQAKRNDKRGRGAQAQHNGKEHDRGHRSSKRDRYDNDQRASGDFQRKRKWVDRDHEPFRLEHGHPEDSGRPLRFHKTPAQILRPISPEPGEISDTPGSSNASRPAWLPAPVHARDEIPHWTGANSAYPRGYPMPEPVEDYLHSYDDNHRSHSHSHVTGYYQPPNRSPDHREYRPRSPSPYYRGRPQRSPSSGPPTRDDNSSREPGELTSKPLLDELQSHIDKLCSSTTSNNIQQNVIEQQDQEPGNTLPPDTRSSETSSRRDSKSSDLGSRPASHNEPASRRSSVGNLSDSSGLGSPLTRIEAELLGFVGADDDDKDTGNRSPKRQQDDRNLSFKRKPRKKVHSVYDRRW